MSALPAAQEALDLVVADLGQPPVEVLPSTAGERDIRAAAAALAEHPRGGLLAFLVGDPALAALLQARLGVEEGSRFAEVQSVPVAEGHLLLALVPARPRPAARPQIATPVRPPRSQDPRLPEQRPVEGATMYELDEDALGDLGQPRAMLQGWPSGYGVLGRWALAAGAAVEVGRALVPTVAGLLALGQRPELFLPGARLVARVDGAEVVFTGDARRQVKLALRWDPLMRGLPPEVLAPLLVNAIAHRDWSVAAEARPIEVVREGPHLEVRSPGTLVHGATTNPNLLALLCRQGLARGQGTGLRRVAEALNRLGARPMSLVARGGEVTAVVDLPWRALPRSPAPPRRPEPRLLQPVETPPVPVAPPPAPEAPPDPVPTPATPTLPPTPAPAPPPTPVYRSAEDRQEELLAHVRQHGRQTTRELFTALGWTRATTRAVLAGLVESGKIRATAGNPNAPYQAYEVCPG
ncbi:MAG: hypothetical protein ABIO70_25830 [Pseudomonadota bacterium]